MVDDKKVVNLLDVSGFIYRAFYGLPHLTANDIEVGALYGYSNAMLKLTGIFKEAMFIAAFDGPRANLKRTEISSEYKANRKEMPTELVSQIPLIREATNRFGFTSVEKPGYEADDIIASYAKKLKGKYVINVISSDKDLMQLMDELNNVNVYDPMKQKYLTNEDILNKFGISEPRLILDVLSLIGDSSDNIKGVPGIGAKTAASLINEYGNLDSLISNVDRLPSGKKYDSLRDNTDIALKARELISLCDDLEIVDFKYAISKPYNLKEFFDSFSFKSLSKNVQ